MPAARFALSFLLIFIPSPRLNSQQSTSAQPRDPQAIALLQSSVRAMGGSVPSDSVATGSVVVVAGSLTTSGTVRILTRGTDQTLEQLSLHSPQWPRSIRAERQTRPRMARPKASPSKGPPVASHPPSPCHLSPLLSQIRTKPSNTSRWKLRASPSSSTSAFGTPTIRTLCSNFFPTSQQPTSGSTPQPASPEPSPLLGVTVVARPQRLF